MNYTPDEAIFLIFSIILNLNFHYIETTHYIEFNYLSVFYCHIKIILKHCICVLSFTLRENVP